jgi:circadian clock protein KaiC
MMHGEDVTMPLTYFNTGSAVLDRILGGGLPERSVTVIAGEPGAGKTVFTLQMLFHLARQGYKSLYFTTLSEPALKLIRYMQLFSFFDPHLLDDRCRFLDLGSTLRTDGIEQGLAMIRDAVEREEPALVVIDSFKAIHDLLGTSKQARGFVYDLAVHMAAWGATTFLVGEYTLEETRIHPEFTIADGIIRLTSRREEFTTVREMEVYKLRGANSIPGRHFFDIGSEGLTFYPRMQVPDVTGGLVLPISDRVTTGVSGLDALLQGGFPRGSATLVEGGTGIGKTLLGLAFLIDGTRQEETGLFFTLDETPEQLREIARGFGWEVAALETQQRFLLSYTSPVELSPDRFLHQILSQIEALGARRVVLDSLTTMALGLSSDQRLRVLAYALVKYCRAAAVTLLMAMEVPELLGTSQLTGHGISSIADNVILMRYVEVGGQLERAISVLKARGVAHAKELRHLSINNHGLEVGDPFTDLRGVLTGIPIPMQENPARSQALRQT